MSRFISYRPDVDGLRSVAVLSVLVYHAVPDLLTGGFVGVDVFFVISGYLIGSILMNEFDRTGRIDFVDFWARRTRRLAPSAILVIVVSLAVGALVLPAHELWRAANDAVYAAVYLSNWQHLFEAVSYFDEGGGASLFLHFWSLAVEEQFYLYLSGVFLVGIFLRGRVRNATGLVTILLIGCGLLSLFLNLTVTYDSQPEAFFGTHTRIWQLTAGVAVGLAERSGRLVPIHLRTSLAWPGIAMILVAVFLLDGELNYPGWIALLPTLGAALLIYSGIVSSETSDRNWSSFRSLPLFLLESRPAIGVGKISYALYLWHWPVFVLWQSGLGSWNAVDIAGAMFLTFSLSIVTHLAVENPFRYSVRLRRNPLRSLAALSVAISVCVAGSIFLGTLAGASQFIRVEGGRVYDLENVRRERPAIYEDGCHLSQSSVEYSACVYGSVAGERSVVLFGDSHAAQWFPAFGEIAAQKGFALYNRTKSACSPIDIAVYNANWKREYTECEEWREMVIGEIEVIRPAVVVIGMSSRHKPLVSGTNEVLSGDSALDALMEGERRTVRRLLDSGVTVILMRDTPWLVEDPLDCLSDHGGTAADYCQWPAEEVLPQMSFPWVAHDGSDVHILDFRDSICPNNTCKALQDGLITLRDRHHLSVDFSISLMPRIAARLEEIYLR